MGRKERQKGDRVERRIVKLLLDSDIPAVRQPRSGELGHLRPDLKDDIKVADLFVESKARANGEGFVTIEKWLGDSDVLLLTRNRKRPMAVLPWRTLIKLLSAYVKS